MSTELDPIIDTLRTMLRECVLRHKTYEDIPETTSHEPMNLAVANRQAIGTISMALVQALSEQRLRGEGAKSEGATLKVVGASA